MLVTVRLFARVRQLVGSETVTVELGDQATIGDLKKALGQHYPDVESLLSHVRFSVDAEYANEQTPIPEGAEVACIPPVSGG